MYSPWTSSMPCLFWSNNSNHSDAGFQSNSPCNSSDDTSPLHDLDLSNPFNIIATISPSSSIWSIHSLHHYPPQIVEEPTSNYFEPLPFSDTHQQQVHYSQLSQNHTMIKQMIARQTTTHRSRSSQFSSCENLFSSSSRQRKRQLCTFCKSNGESASVYTSHNLRNATNDIECPILLAYVCPKCGATGKLAHTIKYCTALSESERVALPTVKVFKEGRSAAGKKNFYKK